MCPPGVRAVISRYLCRGDRLHHASPRLKRCQDAGAGALQPQVNNNCKTLLWNYTWLYYGYGQVGAGERRLHPAGLAAVPGALGLAAGAAPPHRHHPHHPAHHRPAQPGQRCTD